MSVPWLLLVISLPGQNQTLRMRVWRALKAIGAGVLRDGVYMLPKSDAATSVFNEQAGEIQSGGGSAHILTFDSASPAQQDEFVGLFDRNAEYTDVVERLDGFKNDLADLEEAEARRRLAGLRRDVSATAAIDFFPGAALRQVEGALTDTEAALNARFSPDEPHAGAGPIPLRSRADYRGKTWATRAHLWIDRVSSAWLIRRFIDSKAKFLWLAQLPDCPRDALGFDFDGAEFTHVGAKVTFEVLLASFALESDRGLARLGSLIHYLDVGGVPMPEAAGFAAIMAGARASQPTDDALLKAMTPVLDYLYASYSVPPES